MASAAGRLLALAAASMIGVSCAARLPPRPTGSASPSPDATAAFAAATTHCGTLKTLTAELSLSGRAGEQRVRGRVLTGLERGGSARLEGVAPFGAPVFILAARGEQARLLLPRDRRVLDGAPVSQVIERLTGLALGADDLLLALSGCLGAGTATGGRQWPGGWQAVDTAEGRTVFLRLDAGASRLAAVDGGGWRADYGVMQSGYPRDLRLRSADGRVDLRAAVQQLEVNAGIDQAAFDVAVPAGTEPMTLDELRSVAPLRAP